MYFTKLSNLKKLKEYPEETIDKIDKYFASLTRDARNTIDVADISNSLGINYTIVNEIMQRCVGEKLLEKQFAICCPEPECNMVLKIVPMQEVYHYLQRKISCDYCEKENLKITNENIYPIYKLLDRPVSPPSIVAKNKAYELKKQMEGILLDEKSIYDFFFCPDSQELNELCDLYIKAKDDDFKNTTEKGNTLNDLCIYLLNRVKVFHADKTIRKSGNVNQIDCTVHNEITISAAVFEDMGNIFYCECKNEEVKPDNTYYHKLISILNLSNYKLGIIFSRLPATKPCKTIAKDIFLSDKIIIINITLEEIEPIAKGKLNFLELIAEKIFLVKSDASSSGVLFKRE